MKTVYKYKLLPKITIELPRDAKPLCVAAQGDDLCMWCEVLTQNETEHRTFEVFGTGHAIPQDMGIECRYVGTAFMGSLVWHVYERV